MSNLDDIGNLMYLYLEDINSVKTREIPEFLIVAAAKVLKEAKGRNWIPIIVKEIAEDKYEVIGNYYVYAIAQAAGLEKVWCIIAENDEATAKNTRILAQEEIPKINLSTATHDEIRVALQYLIEKENSALKGVKLPLLINRIAEADRQSWKDFKPIIDLKCGITSGKKLNVLEEVFFLTPQPLPELTQDSTIVQNLDLNKLTLKELKNIAKERGFLGYSKKKKDELVKLLSQ